MPLVAIALTDTDVKNVCKQHETYRYFRYQCIGETTRHLA